jgi:peptidoglycan hydrolase-like protein with peptidoglycan-binding domain
MTGLAHSIRLTVLAFGLAALLAPDLAAQGKGKPPADRTKPPVDLAKPPMDLAKKVQQKLHDDGEYSGKVDGDFGKGSVDALKKFQESKGLPSTGELDPKTMEALGLTSGESTGPAAGPVTPEPAPAPEKSSATTGPSFRKTYKLPPWPNRLVDLDVILGIVSTGLVFSAIVLQFLAWRKLSFAKAPLKLTELQNLNVTMTALQAAAKVRKPDPRPQATVLAPQPALARRGPEPTGGISAVREAGRRIEIPPKPTAQPVMPEFEAPQPTPLSPLAQIARAYDLVRTASPSDSDQEREQFKARYFCKRISCTNLEERKRRPDAELRFEAENRGEFVLALHDGQILGFPWFSDDLAADREQLKEIFEYPAGKSAPLGVSRPAVLEPRGEGWVLREPGKLRGDD